MDLYTLQNFHILNGCFFRTILSIIQPFSHSHTKQIRAREESKELRNPKPMFIYFSSILCENDILKRDLCKDLQLVHFADKKIKKPGNVLEIFTSSCKFSLTGISGIAFSTDSSYALAKRIWNKFQSIFWVFFKSATINSFDN